MAHNRTLVFCSLALVACSQAAPTTQTNSVDVAQTDIRDQGRVGFCWGYATLALIESMLVQKGVAIDLSEEALTFQRIAQALHVSLRNAARANDLAKVTIDATGWTRYPQGYAERPENAGIDDGFDIIRTHGVVPESAWSFKFMSADLKQQVFRTIQSNVFRFAQHLEKQGRAFSTVTFDELVDATMVGEKAFPSRPPQAFEWNGVRVSSRDFLASVGDLDSNFDDFVALSASRAEDYERLVQATKRSLAAKVPVPIGFPMSVARLEGNAFSGKGTPPAAAMGRDALIASYAADGGHMMIVTDFVNEGGREGALSEAELARELARPARELSYFKMKNSWGVGPRLTDWGFPVANSTDGYYTVDRPYLEAVSLVAGVDPKFVPFIVVVDRAFLQ